MTVLRSLLFAPGNHPRRVEKAMTLGADAVILDLEDACPIADKIATRPVVVAALQGPRSCLGYIRVNATATPFCFGDLQAVVAGGVDGIVLPKLETAEELRMVEWLMTQLERERALEPGGIDLLPIIETALGLSNLVAIARAGTRVRRVAFGAGDFTLDLDMAWSREEGELLPYRTSVLLASRAGGLEAPLDTVWTDLRDPEGFARSAATGRALGFQGKLCIHPDQVGASNAAFTPTAAAVAHARAVVAAFEAAEREGSASIQLDGQFIDYPIVHRAQRTLATMEKITLKS